jgi:hypothetical protein
MGSARNIDVNQLKNLAANLASRNGTPLPFVADTKSDRGFNSDEAGRMLIPIQYLEAYDKDPVGYGLVRSRSHYVKRPYLVSERRLTTGPRSSKSQGVKYRLSYMKTRTCTIPTTS